TLTEAGRRALCAVLKLGSAPAWTQIKSSHLPALALGIRPGSQEAQAALKDAETIAMAVLRTEYGVTQASTPAALADALVAQQLGLPPGEITLHRIRTHFLAERAGVDAKKGALDSIVRMLAAKALQAHGAKKDALVPALARRWCSAAGALETQPVAASAAAPANAAGC